MGDSGINRIGGEVKCHRRSANRVGAESAKIGIFVRQHDGRLAKQQLGMPDPAIAGIRHPKVLNRAKRGFVEFDRFRCAFGDDVAASACDRWWHGTAPVG